MSHCNEIFKDIKSKKFPQYINSLQEVQGVQEIRKQYKLHLIQTMDGIQLKALHLDYTPKNIQGYCSQP